MNTDLFQTFAGRQIPPADARNAHGARAYRYGNEHMLAQYAATGCLNSTYYATAEAQLDTVLRLCAQVRPEFIARTALYCRERGFMKDLPALLVAVLSVEDGALCERVFERVIDNGKMLRNFVQILRSGAVGRKSLGSLPRRLVRRWLARRSDDQLLRASVGQTPSLADVIRLAHPKPQAPAREALYGYLLGREHQAGALPELVRRLEDFKAGRTAEVPEVPFQLLTAHELGVGAWRAVARQASWQETRMNLNTFARHGVFQKRGMPEAVADKLRDAEAIRRARVLPYQIMSAFLAVDDEVPRVVRSALEDAMEKALANVPALRGKVYVLPDVSGSMSSPLTGHRKGSTTQARCIDVAALVAAAVLRRNPDAEVIPFEHEVVKLRLSAKDSVMTNAAKLARIGGGGTSCAAPLELLNRDRARGDLVIYVSDNESWVDSWAGRGTATMRAWAEFKSRNPAAKLVCIDLQPNRTTQAEEAGDVLNVGGFSDAVFELLGAFAEGGLAAGHWVEVIEAVQLQ